MGGLPLLVGKGVGVLVKRVGGGCPDGSGREAGRGGPLLAGSAYAMHTRGSGSGGDDGGGWVLQSRSCGPCLSMLPASSAPAPRASLPFPCQPTPQALKALRAAVRRMLQAGGSEPTRVKVGRGSRRGRHGEGAYGGATWRGGDRGAVLGRCSILT